MMYVSQCFPLDSETTVVALECMWHNPTDLITSSPELAQMKE